LKGKGARSRGERKKPSFHFAASEGAANKRKGDA